VRSCTIPPQTEPRLLRLVLSATDSCSYLDNVMIKLGFVVVHAPTLIGLKPSFGTTSGGSIITLGGQHLTVMSPSSPLDCVFGAGTRVEAVVVSSQEILCVSPAHNLGLVSLALDVRGVGAVPSASLMFLYEHAIVAKSLWPK
jgi:hypothetical protein